MLAQKDCESSNTHHLMWPPVFSIPRQAPACHIIGFSLSLFSLESIVYYGFSASLWQQIISKNRNAHTEEENCGTEGIIYELKD